MGSKKRSARRKAARPGAADPGPAPTNGASSPAPADSPAARTRRTRRLLVLVLAIAAAGSAWAAVWLLDRTNAAPLLARVPALPDLSDKPDALTEALTDADRALREAIDGGTPADVGRAAGRLGRLYHANAYPDHATQAYALAMSLDEAEARWPYFLATLGQEKGETASVTGLLQRSVELAPDYSPAWLKLADNQFKQGHADAARASYERRLALSPGDPYAQLGLARLALAGSRWAEAESHLERVIESDPDFDPAYRLLASVHEHFGRQAEMQAALRRADAASRFSPAPDPWVDGLLEECFDIDWLLFQVGRYVYVDHGRMAQMLFDRAVQLDPGNPEVYVVFGQHAQSPAEARQAFEKAISLAPEHAEAHALLGEALLMDGQPADAERVLSKALALGATSAAAYKNLALCLASRGRFDEAIDHVDRGLALQPESVGAQYARATILRAAGRTPEAVQQYRALLQARPSHTQAAQELAALLQSSRR